MLPIVIHGSHLHIAIDGCLGVGKTTLATKLADIRKANLLLEDFEKNPFLSDFYSDPVAHVLETELQFLLLHYHQLKQRQRTTVGETISDFTFSKDLLYAQLNFRDAAENSAFNQLYEFLLGRLAAPDLIIYLRGSDDLIIKRIRQRNRAIEQTIDGDYFKRLTKTYENHYSSTSGPVLIINADEHDYLNNPEAVKGVSAAIDAILKRTPSINSPSNS